MSDSSTPALPSFEDSHDQNKDALMLNPAQSKVHSIESASKRKTMHFHRTDIQIRPKSSHPSKPTEPVYGRILLNEFTPVGLVFFAKGHLPIHEQVSLVIESPRKFYCNAKVIWTKEMSKEASVFSKDKFQIRIGLQFEFKSQEERNSAYNFFEELNNGLRKAA